VRLSGDAAVIPDMKLWLTSMSRAPAIACLLWAAVGCGSGGSDKPASAAAEPVAECRQYESALGACFHRRVSVANHASLQVANNDDRARVRALCLENLQRIKTACR